MTMKQLPCKTLPRVPLCSGVLRLPHAIEAQGMRHESGLLIERHGLPICRLPAYLKSLKGPVGWFLSHGTESSAHVGDIHVISSSD